MRLTKIYSNNNLFKEVIFNDNLNIVLGTIKNPEKVENDSHNLGKTTLISLIDFLLLKRMDKDHFLNSKHFRDDIYFLEINTNFGKNITIKRSVNNNTKISIKIHDERHLNLVNEVNWDYMDLPLGTRDSNKNPRNILNDLIGLKIDCKEYFYRDIITYFMRSQIDYNDIFRLSKYKGKDIDWKPILFSLLGFDGKILFEKYKLEESITLKEKLIEELEKEYSVESTEKEKLKNIIEIKDNNISNLVKEMDSFNFFEIENNDMKNLVNNIENEISKLNTIKYKLSKEVKLIRESLDKSINFDLEKTFKLFQEIKLLFTDSLQKDYKDLVQFNNQITKDREKYLRISLSDKQKLIKDIDLKLEMLSDDRKKKLGFLGTTDPFNKYKELQLKLIKMEKEKEIMSVQLQYVDKIKQSDFQINQQKKELEEIILEIDLLISNSNNYFNNIRYYYSNNIKKTINKEVSLYLTQNKNGNIDFNSSIIFDDEETKEGEGNTYKKIMCAAFDISLLTTYEDNNFIKFVIHDGVFESLEGRRKQSYLKLVKELTTTTNIQYIFTAIEEDIDQEFLIKNLDSVCVNLNDDDNYLGTLFGRRF